MDIFSINLILMNGMVFVNSYFFGVYISLQNLSLFI